MSTRAEYERRGEGLFAGCNIPPQPGSPGTEHANSVAVPISRLRHVTPVARGHLEQYFGATDPTSLPGTTSRPLAEWERASDAELWRASELLRLTDWNQAFVAGQEPFSALPEALRERNGVSSLSCGLCLAGLRAALHSLKAGKYCGCK